VTPLLSTAVLRTQSDKRLATLARAGHEVAFEAIVERYRPQLRRYCARLVPESRVDDALQQAFLLAWTALQDGAPVRELRPWLYTVVHNAAVGQLRRGAFDYVELADTLEGAGATDDDVERRTEARRTLAAVAALPSRQREALLAVALDGRPQAEVAHEMGLTGNGLRQLLFRARTTVRATATALTPLPALQALLGAGGALPAGTALVVAGSLAVGGAVGLRTPAVHAPAPALARTPTAAPLAAQRARTAVRGAPLRVVRLAVKPTVARRARPVAPARPVALLRGSHGLRVSARITPRGVAVAPAPAAVAVPQPAVPPPAPAPAPAAVVAVAPEPTVAAGDGATATAPPAADPVATPAQGATPRSGEDRPDDGDKSDDGENEGED
jgi:RNA polymerase sigma factor (sigma-70 family)